MAKTETAITLFGIDISTFNKLQQAFLINYRYAKTEADCIRALGVNKSTVTKWKKTNPQFKGALKQIKALAIRVDAEAAENPHIVQARTQAQDIVADVVPTAAQQLSELIQIPWDKCTDRGKSTKLKAVEDALRITGVESKGKTSSGKIDLLQLIYEVTQEKEGRDVSVDEKG